MRRIEENISSIEVFSEGSFSPDVIGGRYGDYCSYVLGDTPQIAGA
jgi:hypothetical protein